MKPFELPGEVFFTDVCLENAEKTQNPRTNLEPFL